MLRILRDGATGGPARGTRLVALLVVLGLVGVSATALSPVLRWIIAVL